MRKLLIYTVYQSCAIKSKKILWTGLIACMGEMHTILWLKNLTGIDHLGLDVDRSIFKWILKKQVMRM
jgi:hypothetical protein